MSTVSVSVPGTGKELVLETDPASGRTAGRIDGRPVMRPLAADEDEREFQVGLQKFLLRRLADGDFDVDMILSAPAATGNTWNAPLPPAVEAPPKRTRTAIGGAVIGLLLLLLVRVLSRGVGRFIGSMSDPIEVTSFTCQPVGRAEFEAIVDLKNLTSDPLELTGHITIIGLGSIKTEYNAPVDPLPLPPKQTGRLYIKDYMPSVMNFGAGQCKLNLFRDAKGKVVGYREAKGT